MDLLLDVNVVMDYCVPRVSWSSQVRDALEHCSANGRRIWLYAGSSQTMLHRLFDELRQIHPDMPNCEIMQIAKCRLSDFAQDKHWLAALADEGDVFDTEDPENEQLLRSLDRFAPETVVLLTRDATLLENNPKRTISPRQYCQRPIADSSLNLIDLRAQQDAIRLTMEKRIHRVLHHNQYVLGPEVCELEEMLAAYVGVKHCIAVSSGTDALLVAMMALGVGAGDEVITTPFTFISTGEMIALLGAKPIFVDIDMRTYAINANLIEAAITDRTKAIVPVSLYGQCADFDAINAIAAKHVLPVIEDAAQSFGATYKGRRSCALSTIGITSFFPSKPLGGYGDGGALFTNDTALAKAMREIRIHGQDKRYHHSRIGINSRLDTVQAAVLLAKFECFPHEVDHRQRIGHQYTNLIDEQMGALGDGLRIVPPYVAKGNTSVYAQYTIQVDARDVVTKLLNKIGVPTAIHYPVPLSLQAAFESYGYRQGDFPIAEVVAKRVMSLPMGAYMSRRDQVRIVSAVMDAVSDSTSWGESNL